MLKQEVKALLRKEVAPGSFVPGLLVGWGSREAFPVHPSSEVRCSSPFVGVLHDRKTITYTKNNNSRNNFPRPMPHCRRHSLSEVEHRSLLGPHLGLV